VQPFSMLSSVQGRDEAVSVSRNPTLFSRFSPAAGHDVQQ
jgi:hypothetical protein